METHPIIKATMDEAYKLYFQDRDEDWELIKDGQCHIGFYIDAFRGKYLLGHARRY
jgi:hypothetical protein